MWTVYEMASSGRWLGISRPSLGCQLDALGSAYSGVSRQADARAERMFVPGDPCRRVLFHYRRREVENICATDENIIVAFKIDKIVLQPFIQQWRPLRDERVIAVRQTQHSPLVFY